MNIYNSLYEIDVLGAPKGDWNSFANYKKMFTDPSMITSIKNTAKMIFYVIVFQGGIGLVLALLVDMLGKWNKFYRVVYFFPMVISATALGLLFNLLYLFPNGPLNDIMTSLGFNEVIWKGERTGFLSIMIPTIWQSVGFYFIIYLMGINSISKDIFEAGELDGATGFRKVRYITLPLLYNVMVTCLVLQVIGAFKVFDLPWVLLPHGQPTGTTFLTGTYMYQMTFVNRDVDYGSAIAVFMVVMGVVLSLVINKVFKSKDY